MEILREHVACGPKFFEAVGQAMDPAVHSIVVLLCLASIVGGGTMAESALSPAKRLLASRQLTLSVFASRWLRG